MLVWLSSFPRSGNTFLRMCLHWYTAERVSSYSITDDPLFIKVGVADKIGHQRLKELDSPQHISVEALKKLDDSEELYIIKTHKPIARLSYQARTIFLVRDPRDAMVSLVHWRQWQLDNKKVAHPTWQKTFNGMYNKRHWHTFTELSIDLADVIVKYEDLVAAPYETVERIITELDLPLTMEWQVMPTFEEMHEKLPRFFRKGVVGSGRTVFTPEQDAAFYARSGAMMDRLGYERYYPEPEATE